MLVLSCKKESHPLGLEVQPEYDILHANVKELKPVSIYTQAVDSILSFNDDLKFLGSIQDASFGRTDVGLYVNPNISVSNLSFGDTAVLISSEIVLQAYEVEYMGLASSILNYSVYTLDSALSQDRIYYSNNMGLHNTNSVVAAYTGSYTTLDAKVVIRIPVDSLFASDILKNPQYLVDNATFQAKYKGFYISSASSQLNPSSNPGIITRFDLSSSLSGLYLKYKVGPKQSEIKSFRFTFNGDDAVRYNTVKYQAMQGGHYLLTGQLKGDTAKGNESVFLKGLACTIAKVNIPISKNSADSSYISVNRAEVIFNVDESFLPSSADGKYEAPPILCLIPLDENGNESLSAHSYNVSNLSRYNGVYDNSAKRYVFDIARFAQLVMRGSRVNHGFHLVVTDPSMPKVLHRDQYQNRVVLHGMNKGDLRPRCNLYYVNMKEK